MMEMAGNKLDEFAEICAKTANMRGNEWNKSAKAYAKTAMRNISRLTLSFASCKLNTIFSPKRYYNSL